MSNLKRKDFTIIGIGAVLSLIMAWWGTTVGTEKAMMYESGTILPVIPMILVMGYLLWRFQQVWGGELGHDFRIMAVGIIIGTTLSVAHTIWHIIGQTQGGALPAWGVSVDFWIVFFHIGQATFYGITAYGAYRLHKIG